MKPNVLGMKLKNKINIKKIGTKKITIKRIMIKFDTKNK
jgi:hypothetical protein